VEFVLQQIINGVALGSIYALMAIGLALIFGILRLINFAHGELLMVGPFFALALLNVGLPFGIAALLAVALTGALGVLMERLAYRPLRGAPDVTLLLTSLAVSIFLQNGTILVQGGGESKPFRGPAELGDRLQIMAGVGVSSIDLFIMGATLILLVLFTLFVTRTVLGVSMRATAENLVAAQLVGINVGRVIMVAFVVGAAMAAVAGILWGVRVGKIDPLMGFIPVLKAFVATVIGGFGSIPGAVLGGFVLGILEIFLAGSLPPGTTGYRDAIIFALLVVVLLVRPQGILGSSEREGV
jgi:branched-chain amino acid transport system permease protein